MKKNKLRKLAVAMNNIMRPLELIQDDSFLPLLHSLHHHKNKQFVFILLKGKKNTTERLTVCILSLFLISRSL